MARSFSQLTHLARRFVHGFEVSPPGAEDEAWVASRLAPAELALWRAQAPTDRRHSLAVARLVADRSGSETPTWVVAAALLHDVGKADAPLGPCGRALATVLELAGIRRAPGSVGRYLTYQGQGAEMLRAVGADERVAAWARDHHRAERSWDVPLHWGRVLRTADDAAD